jgi:DNA-binding transcriptional regulator YiaG
MSLTTEERFWAKVNKDGPTMPHMATPCWVWTAATRDGYGNFHGYGQRYAHRVAWAMAESLPAGMQVCHHCDNPGCVRRDHLFLGTHQDNVNDKVTKGRQARGCRARSAILNPATANAIREEYASGNVSQNDLAEKYGVSRPTISAVTTGRLWRDEKGRAALADSARVAS